jgi:glutathione S-transferase
MKGQGEPDEEQVASFKQKLNTNLDVYEKILSKQPYLAGDVSINIPNIPSTGSFFCVQKFTLADLFHLPYGAWLAKIGEGDLIESRPNVKQWWDRITSRISWKTVQAMQ